MNKAADPSTFLRMPARAAGKRWLPVPAARPSLDTGAPHFVCVLLLAERMDGEMVDAHGETISPPPSVTALLARGIRFLRLSDRALGLGNAGCLALLPSAGLSPILVARRPLKAKLNLQQLARCHEQAGAALTVCRSALAGPDCYMVAPGLSRWLETEYHADLSSLVDRLFSFGEPAEPVARNFAPNFGMSLSEMD